MRGSPQMMWAVHPRCIWAQGRLEDPDLSERWLGPHADLRETL